MSPTGNQARWFLALATLALCLALLWFLKPVLVPVALAIFMAFILTPAVVLLERARLPRVPAVITVVVFALGMVGAIGWLTTSQATSLLASLPSYERNLAARIESLQGKGGDVIDRVQRMIDRLASKSERVPEEPAASGRAKAQRATNEPLPVRVIDPPTRLRFSQLREALVPTLEVLATAGFAIVLVIFMLIGREDIRDRVISLLGSRRVTTTTRAVDEITARLGRYLIRQLAVNSGFGAVFAAGLFAIGVPYALVWGLLAAILRYIPYLGPWIAASLPLMLSLLISDSWTMTLHVLLFVLVLESITNMFVEPVLYGRGIGVSQWATLVMVAFWTWLWGPVGLVLATPLTVCVLVLGKYNPSLVFLGTLLGDEPALAPEVSFYQRVLADDEDEALAIAQTHLATKPLHATFDALLIAALARAKTDLDRDALSAAEFDRVTTTICNVGEVLHRLDMAAGSDDAALPAGMVAGDLPDTSAIAPDTAASSARPGVALVAVAGAGDLAAVRLLALALDPKHHNLQIQRPVIASDLLEALRATPADLVCLVNVGPRGGGTTRLLTLRLKEHFPDLPVVIARWGFAGAQQPMQSHMVSLGAAAVVGTLAETVVQLAAYRHLDVGAQRSGDGQRRSLRPQKMPPPPQEGPQHPATELRHPPAASGTPTPGDLKPV